MQDAVVTVDGSRQNTDAFSSKSEQASLSIFGNIEEGMALQDGDTLLMQVKNNPLQESVEVIIENKDGVYLSTGVSFTPSAIAAQMEEHLCVCIADTKHKNVMSTAIQIYSKAIELYEEFPAFRNIMVKDQEGCTQEKSLLALVITQDEDFVKWAETMILSMDSKYKTLFPVAKQVLEHSTSNTGFTLLSKEEQVAAFLEFSKRHADKAVEIVPDRLIKYLKNSLEYAETVSKLKQAGLGESETQQFNVLQQIGYFGGFISDIKKGNVIYNLSDMGAGKTLMTVEAIYALDCINIGAWNRAEKNEFVNVTSILLPDKHIIAPALSVKASWVDTFRLFYEVEKVTDCHYILTAEFNGVKAKSDLFIAPFTVRSGKVFVQETLPEPSGYDTYLIVDEIHQLVRRRISRTKFFVPKIVPVENYRIFALSGTMSNLKSGEWLSLIRFLGDTNILLNAGESTKQSAKLNTEYKTEISDVARDIETLQHRKFNIDDVSMENRHVPTIKKKSVVEESYFMKYGSKILVPRGYANSMSVQNVLGTNV